MRITKKKAVVVVAVAAVAMAGAGGAYAYWTTGGTGDGSATAGDAVEFEIDQTNVVTDLFPGIAQTVNFTVTNPATFNQYLTNVAVTVDAFTKATDATKPDCTAADFLVGVPQVTAGQIDGDNGTKTGTVSLTLKNLNTNQDNCKNAAPKLTFVAS